MVDDAGEIGVLEIDPDGKNVTVAEKAAGNFPAFLVRIRCIVIGHS